MIEFDKFNESSRKRIVIAKEFLSLLQDKMGKYLRYAYIYGSVAKNSATEESDIDLILVVKKPTAEEKAFMNSVEGGLWQEERQGSLNFAYNSHYLFKFKEALEEKYHVEISPYYHYEEEGIDKQLRSTPFTLRSILESKDYFKYPDDFQNL